jgi:uroporphyrinogen decarboxylase
MEYRERVLCSLAHKQPDRTPTDFQAVGEIWQMMFKHYKTDDMKDVLDGLEIDVAWVDPQVNREPEKKDENGLIIGWGGSRLKKVYNDFGAHDEVVSYVTQDCESPQDIDRVLDLPDLNNWDFESVVANCNKYEDRFLIGGFASIFYFPTLVRNMEDIFIDMVLNPKLIKHLLKRCYDWHLDYHERLLKAGAGRIDAMQLADDFSSQVDILLSIDMFREYFKPAMKDYIDLAKSYNATPFLHCCGSAYNLMQEFVDMGIKILDPVQTVAANMEPKKIKKEFGEHLTFHGAGETQDILPNGTTQKVRDNAKYLSSVMGEDGGYIMSSCHFLQADVPLENVLAFYDIENRY